MPRSLSQKQTRRLLSALLIAISTLVLGWRISVHVSAQTATIIFSDDFNSTTRDTTKWKIGVLNVPSSAFSTQVSITQGPTLNIKPVANTSVWSHSGYVSVAAFNLTGARATVEVPQVTAGSAYTILAVGIDSNNWYRISAHSGQVDFQDTVAGVKNSVSVTYNATQLHYWRISHDSTHDTIVFATSADGRSSNSRRPPA